MTVTFPYSKSHCRMQHTTVSNFAMTADNHIQTGAAEGFLFLKMP